MPERLRALCPECGPAMDQYIPPEQMDGYKAEEAEESTNPDLAVLDLETARDIGYDVTPGSDFMRRRELALAQQPRDPPLSEPSPLLAGPERSGPAGAGAADALSVNPRWKRERERERECAKDNGTACHGFAGCFANARR